MLFRSLLDRATRPRRLGFSACVLIGIVVGSALYAMLTGTYSLTWSYQGAATRLSTHAGPQFVALILAGLALGVGARTAGGCTSGHGLSGVSLGSPASLVATTTFFATAVAVSYVFAWFVGGTS